MVPLKNILTLLCHTVYSYYSSLMHMCIKDSIRINSPISGAVKMNLEKMVLPHFSQDEVLLMSLPYLVNKDQASVP